MKGMFVMNFGAVPRDPQNGDWSFIIPNEAMTSQDGFPDQGMPLLWLLNANEGETVQQTRQYQDDQGNVHNVLLTGKLVNYLYGYAHVQDVYAAVVVPGSQLLGQNSLAETFGPIWDIDGLPVVEANVEAIKSEAQTWGLNDWIGLTRVIGHELGHTVLWHIDHNPNDTSQAFGGGGGHHVIGQNGRIGQHTIECLMWPYFPASVCPNGFALCLQFDPQWQNHWIFDQGTGRWIPDLTAGWIIFTPAEFCDTNPDCQHLWRLKP